MGRFLDQSTPSPIKRGRFIDEPQSDGGFNFNAGEILKPLTNPGNIISNMAPQMAAGEAYNQVADYATKQVPQSFKDSLGKSTIHTLLGTINPAFPSMIQGGERQIGEIATRGGIDILSGGVSDAMGAAAPGLANRVLRPLQRSFEDSAGKTMNELIKPLNRNMQFGKNPGLEMAKRGITAWSQKGLKKKVDAQVADLDRQLDIAVSTGKPVDLSGVVKRLGQEYRSAKMPLGVEVETGAESAEGIKTLASDIYRMAGEDIKNVPAKKALEIKRWIGKQVSWASRDPKSGSLASAGRKGYRSLDESMDSAIPETKAINQSQSNMLGAKDALEHGTAREARKSPFGLFDRLAMLGLGGAGFASGGGMSGAKAALLGLGLSKMAGSTIAKSSTASTLAKGSKLAGGTAKQLENLKDSGIYKEILRKILEAGNKPKPNSLLVRTTRGMAGFKD